MYRTSRLCLRRCLLGLLIGILSLVPRGAGAEEQTSHPRALIDRYAVLSQANESTVMIKAQRTSKRQRSTSHGAGVVVSANGYIVTANHVVRGYDNILVRTVDAKTMPARVILTEPTFDIAVIKVERAVDLVPASLASRDQVISGRDTVIIGNPEGAGQSAKAGVLGDVKTVRWDGCRAVLRAVHGSILKGHSGGGTFDQATGQLLGINVAKSSAASDTGYMVPVDQLTTILDRKLPILGRSKMQEIYDALGVRLREVGFLSEQYSSGLLITSVGDDGVAERAGWRIGDVLLGIDKYKAVDSATVLHVLQNGCGNVPFVLFRRNCLNSGRIDLSEARSVGTLRSPVAP